MIRKTVICLGILLTNLACYSADLYSPVEFSPNEAVFEESKRIINVIDPTVASNAAGISFPGGRGANQLVIYTPKFGDRTNTNEFGTEAIVQGNIVTMLSGANSFIPQDGVVISGHGVAKAWINQNINVGTKIFIDNTNNYLHVYTTSESYMYEANEKINETKSMIDYYRNNLSNYSGKESNSHIQLASVHLKNAQKYADDERLVQKYTKASLDEANLAMETVLPNLSGELKGVWLRPTEKSEQEIIETLDCLKSIGINNVFLETFFHGRTIYPSEVMKKYGFVEQNEEFDFDTLKVWVNEAHKRGIKIHTWFQSFYVGNKKPNSNPKNILAVRPYWGNKTRYDCATDTPTMSRAEHNGYFLDPANPEVQDFLTQLVSEIIETYCPDGINLDYIRYPQAIGKKESGNWGYTSYARNDFQDMYGTDPVFLDKEDDLWNEWNNYRREHVTNFVRKIGTIGRQKCVYVSTVIFPDVTSALNDKQQDWRTWSVRGYINGFTPLFLTYDPKMVASMMNDVTKIKSLNTDIYAGIFVTFMGGSKEDLVRQIHETRKLRANGVILFDYAHTKGEYSSMLAKSAFQPTTKTKNEQKKQKKKKSKSS